MTDMTDLRFLCLRAVEFSEGLSTFDFTMSGTFVLDRPHSGFVKSLRGMERPIGITEHFPSQRNNICLPGEDNLIGLLRCCDHAHRARRNADLPTDPLGECNLVSGTDGNLLARVIAAGRAVNEIDAFDLQKPSERNGIFYSEAAFRNFV